MLRNPEFDAKDVDPDLHKRMNKAVEDDRIKSRCFWQETRLQQSLTSTVSARNQASLWGAPMQQRWMAGAVAMSKRTTSGCGSLGAESHACQWEVLWLRRLPIGSSLRRRLVSIARLMEN
jgi:hypothetical protein